MNIRDLIIWLLCMLYSIPTAAEVKDLGPWQAGDRTYTGAGEHACKELRGENVAGVWCVVSDSFYWNILIALYGMAIYGMAITALLAYPIWKKQQIQVVGGTENAQNQIV